MTYTSAIFFAQVWRHLWFLNSYLFSKNIQHGNKCNSSTYQEIKGNNAINRKNALINTFHFAVTEQEIQNGILNSTDPSAQSLCYIRHIEDIDVNLDDRKAGLYIDVQQPGIQDEEAQDLLDKLKRKRVLQVSIPHCEAILSINLVPRAFWVFFKMTVAPPSVWKIRSRPWRWDCVDTCKGRDTKHERNYGPEFRELLSHILRVLHFLSSFFQAYL